MTSTHNKYYNTTAQEFSCGAIVRDEFKQAPDTDCVVLELWKAHGMYHVRSHDFELFGRMKWDSYDTLYAARHRFAELKRKYKAGMKCGMFNTTLDKGFIQE